MTQTFKEVAFNYVKLAKELDQGYEKVIFDLWRSENTDEAIKLLKNSILKPVKSADGNTTYIVQFDPQLKVIIREAKFLERIGKNIP